MNTNEKNQQYNQPTGACQSQGGIRRIQMRRNSNTTQPTGTCQSHARQSAKKRAAQVRLSLPRLLFSPRGVVRVIGQFSQTCRLTAENDEGPMA